MCLLAAVAGGLAYFLALRGELGGTLAFIGGLFVFALCLIAFGVR
jgi:hypothetical protein